MTNWDFNEHALPEAIAARVDARYANGVGPGWFPLLEQLDRDLAALDSDYRLLQVKEKFAALRVYPAGAVSEEMNALIDAAAVLSAKTCERCGQPGVQRPGGWVIVLCDDCSASRSR